MPLDGHWNRVNTPLRRLGRRERNIAIGALIVTIAATVAIIFATIGNSRPPVAPGCVYALVPGPTGVQPAQGCGADAKALCADNAGRTDPGAKAIIESCRKQGLL